MTAPDIIKRLVDNFERQRRTYMSQGYNEAQVRLEFIDPFFEALGWDMYNRGGYALAYELYGLTEEEIKIVEGK